MADKVELEIAVTGSEKSINSVKELKQALKDARDAQLSAASAFGEGSKEFIAASQNVSKLKDKVEDLNDSTQSLKGSGVEKLTSSMGLLKQGFLSFDTDKISTGLKGLGNAFKAIPIFLILEGVRYLVENFNELSEGSGILAKSLRFVGDIIESVKDGIYSLTDAIGLTNSELDKQGDAIKTNAEKAKEGIASQTAEYDRQIAIAKASGKSAVQLEKDKQEAIINTNKALVEQTIAYVRQGGILNDEQKKLLTEQLDAIKGARNQQKVIEITANKESNDNYKKYLEDRKKLRNDYLGAIENEQQNQINYEAQQRNFANQLKKEQDAADLESTKLKLDSQTELEFQAQLKITQEREKQRKLEEDGYKELENNKYQFALQGTQAAQSVTDAFFAFKSRSLKKGSAEELESAKKQFEVNKAFQLGNATITGYQSVMNAYATGLASPITAFFPAYPFVQAALAGVTSAANIAKIAASKFGGGGASSLGATSGASGSNSNSSVPAPPVINTPQANTLFDNSGKNLSNNQTINVKASIGVDEVTKKQSRVDVLERQSTF